MTALATFYGFIKFYISITERNPFEKYLLYHRTSKINKLALSIHSIGGLMFRDNHPAGTVDYDFSLDPRLGFELCSLFPVSYYLISLRQLRFCLGLLDQRTHKR